MAALLVPGEPRACTLQYHTWGGGLETVPLLPRSHDTGQGTTVILGVAEGCSERFSAEGALP